MPKRKSKKPLQSPTASSMEWAEDKGFEADICERHIPYSHIKKDLFGFADIAAVKKQEENSLRGQARTITGTLYIQATTIGNMNARVKKIQRLASARHVLLSGNEIVVHGWGWRGKRGAEKVWTLKEKHLSLGATGVIFVA